MVALSTLLGSLLLQFFLVVFFFFSLCSQFQFSASSSVLLLSCMHGIVITVLVLLSLATHIYLFRSNTNDFFKTRTIFYINQFSFHFSLGSRLMMCDTPRFRAQFLFFSFPRLSPRQTVIFFFFVSSICQPLARFMCSHNILNPEPKPFPSISAPPRLVLI